jgi:hypothetical protein
MKWFEIVLIKIAAWILIGRNVQRSQFVSRSDNTDMWYMSEKLEGVIKRMESDYAD